MKLISLETYGYINPRIIDRVKILYYEERDTYEVRFYGCNLQEYLGSMLFNTLENATNFIESLEV